MKVQVRGQLRGFASLFRVGPECWTRVVSVGSKPATHWTILIYILIVLRKYCAIDFGLNSSQTQIHLISLLTYICVPVFFSLFSFKALQSSLCSLGCGTDCPHGLLTSATSLNKTESSYPSTYLRLGLGSILSYISYKDYGLGWG